MSASGQQRQIQLNGLAARMETALTENPYSGHVFVFRGWRGDMIKVPWWTGDGLCLLAKRLEKGRFVWPQATSGSVTLSQAQLSMLPGLVRTIVVFYRLMPTAGARRRSCTVRNALP